MAGSRGGLCPVVLILNNNKLTTMEGGEAEPRRLGGHPEPPPHAPAPAHLRPLTCGAAPGSAAPWTRAMGSQPPA